MVVETLLGPALHSALTGGTMGVAAKNALNAKDDGTLKVLGNPLTDPLADTETEKKESKSGKKWKYYNVDDLSKDEMDELLIHLAERGIDSRTIREISKSGLVHSSLEKFLPGWLRGKLVQNGGYAYNENKRRILQSPMLNPGPDDDDEEKKKKEEAKEETKEDLKEVEKARAERYNESAQRFNDSDELAQRLEKARKFYKKANDVWEEPIKNLPKLAEKEASREAMKRAASAKSLKIPKFK